MRMHVCSFVCSFICFIYFTKGKERRKYFNHGIEDINDNKPFSMSIKVDPACLSSQVRSWLIQSVKKKLSSASFLHISFDLCLTKDGQHRSSVSKTLSGSDLFLSRNQWRSDLTEKMLTGTLRSTPAKQKMGILP